MLIQRTSKLSGITRTIDIDCTKEQYIDWLSGASIQDVMPHLSADDREFLLTGITKEEWDSLFKEKYTND
jgi:hypothetical protein